jgi:hypothetical protein
MDDSDDGLALLTFEIYQIQCRHWLASSSADAAQAGASAARPELSPARVPAALPRTNFAVLASLRSKSSVSSQPIQGSVTLCPSTKPLSGIDDLSAAQHDHRSTRLGSCLTLSEIAGDARFGAGCSALAQAASLVATPHIRNSATLGGNICLDTRCLFYNQSYDWRKAINFCRKKDGERCWVAPGSERCMAVSSTDTAPALIALGASVRLKSRSQEREVALEELYDDDGVNFLARKPNEILTEIVLGSLDGWKNHLLEAATAQVTRFSRAVSGGRSPHGERRHGRRGADRSRRRWITAARRGPCSEIFNRENARRRRDWQSCGIGESRRQATLEYRFRHDLAQEGHLGICHQRTAGGSRGRHAV